MVYNWHTATADAPPLAEADRVERGSGRGPGEQDADFRKRRNRDNDWLIDRQVQKTETFTGIDGINTQDHAVQESMGPIVDRSREHLGPPTKRSSPRAACSSTPCAPSKPAATRPGTGPSYYGLRAIEQVLPPDADWRAALQPYLRCAPALAR